MSEYSGQGEGGDNDARRQEQSQFDASIRSWKLKKISWFFKNKEIVDFSKKNFN